jgi:membrane protease YdiL (CAAX protease family)
MMPPAPPGPPGYVGPNDPYGRPPWWTPADPRRWGLGDVGYGLLVAIGGQTVVGVLLVIFGVSGTGSLDLPPWGILLSVAAGWLGFIGWPVLASYVKGQRSLALDFGMRFQPVDLGWGVLGGLTVLAFTIALNLFWVVVTGDTAPGNSGFLPESPSLLTGLVLFLAVAVITPIAEELFFRGLLLRALEKRFNTTIAIVVSAMVFGALHITGVTSASNYGELAVQGLFIAVVITGYGLVFALLDVYTGRLWPSIISHMVINGIGVVSYLAT